MLGIQALTEGGGEDTGSRKQLGQKMYRVNREDRKNMKELIEDIRMTIASRRLWMIDQEG